MAQIRPWIICVLVYVRGPRVPESFVVGKTAIELSLSLGTKLALSILAFLISHSAKKKETFLWSLYWYIILINKIKGNKFKKYKSIAMLIYITIVKFDLKKKLFQDKNIHFAFMKHNEL